MREWHDLPYAILKKAARNLLVREKKRPLSRMTEMLLYMMPFVTLAF